MADERTGASGRENLKSDSGKSSADENACRIAKRMAQHEQWMRVMMEGQSTPDLRYQRAKK